ncbi:MAG: hypothetical protein R3A52_25235 [Polyangiales bacterium]
MRAALSLSLSLGLAAACSSTPDAPADASVDARADLDINADAPAATDVVTDAPALTDLGPLVVTPGTCTPCLRDETCGGEPGTCVPLGVDVAPGLRECHLPCAAVGAPCDAPVPSTCTEDAQGRPRCVPDAPAACVPMSSRRGAACPDEGCTGRYSLCVNLDATHPSLGRAGDVCLGPCARDSDCDDGARRCREVVTRDGRSTRACVPDDRVGPEACGVTPVNASGVGGPCTSGCAAGLRCSAADDAGAMAFCTRDCDDDAQCGDGARCLSLNGARACVPTDCACLAGARSALLDRALDQGSPAWTRCDLYFSGATLDAFPSYVTRDRFRLPIFDRVHRDWLYGARWARDLGPALDRDATTLSGAIRAAAGLRETGATTALPSPTPLTDAGPLVDAIAEVFSLRGQTADRAAIAADASDLSPALQSAMARVLRAAIAAARARDEGLARYPDALQRRRLFTVAPYVLLPTSRFDERINLGDPYDLGIFLGDVTLPARAAADLAATVESVEWSALRGATATFTQATPLGAVVVRGAGDDAWSADDHPRVLLGVDLGGDDTYTAPVASNVDVDTPVSVMVDLGGDDAYGYPERRSTLDTAETLPSDADGRQIAGGTTAASMSRTGRQGSGRLGVALLYDLGAGRDTYRSLRMSQGFGALGVGGLYDDGGDDTYAVEAAGQGATVAGVGVLLDAGGDDDYSAFTYSQGFAYTGGAGLLVDRGGSDGYTARVTPNIYPSAQSPTTNNSMSQGVGFGRRGDGAPDRVNMSGGLGVLRDARGNDRYTASVFAQGSGYWGGMGLLLDGAGDDRYDARWYVQGAAAHFAYGALVDGGGRDDHNAEAVRQNMTLGAGHDFSLGLFVSLGAEPDVYRAPNLALGAGNANGAGLFFEAGGDDRYEAASALSLGNAALESLTDPGRLMRPTAGVFVDGAGADTYARTVGSGPTNDGRWTQRTHDEAPSERGFGVDGAGDTGL